MNRTIARSLIGAAVALAAALAPSQASAQTTFTACRVPDVGAIYMIGVAGAPTECLDASHVEFSWTEGGAAALADGSITTEKLADGAVTSAKLASGAVGSAQVLDNSLTSADFAAGAVGQIRTTDIGAVSNLPTTATNLGSISVTAPKAGTVLVALTGSAIFFGENTRIVVGLGTTAGSLNLHQLNVGTLDGTETDRYYVPFTPMAVVSVSAGTTTFYASGNKTTTFDANDVNLTDVKLVLTYLPN